MTDLNELQVYTKVHVAVKNNGLPISIVISPANIHDSTEFVNVVESISDFLNDESIKQIKSVYADKGYDSIPSETI